MTRSRTRRSRATLAAIAAAVGVLALGVAVLARSDDPVATTAADPPGPACTRGDAPRGYALTGNIYKAVVRRITLCPVLLGDPVLADAPEQAVSWLTGTGARVVAAEFGTGKDRITTADGSRLVPVPDLGEQVGHTPALAPDGRLAWVEQRPGADGTRFAVRLFDPTRRQRRDLLIEDEPVASLAWGPGGRLGFLAGQSGPSPAFVVLDPATGHRRKVAPLPRAATDLLWLRSGPVVVQVAATKNQAAHSVVLDTTGSRRGTLPPGWRPVGQTRDGALVGVSSSGEVARLAAPAFDQPELYGALAAGETIWQVVL